jgi:ABC-type polysaccharide/polyol phosphate export permease
MAWFVTRLRDLLLFGEMSFDGTSLAMVLLIVVFAWLSLRFFRRFSGHFEDFL